MMPRFHTVPLPALKNVFYFHRDILQPDVELMIRNYVDIVRRDIVEDQELIGICNKIYNKHKKALDLIFENRTDGKTQMLSIQMCGYPWASRTKYGRRESKNCHHTR